MGLSLGTILGVYKERKVANYIHKALENIFKRPIIEVNFDNIGKILS